MLRRSLVLATLVALALVACSRNDAAVAPAPLDSAATATAPGALVAAPSLRDGEIVLDQRDDGAALIARIEPAPPNGDPERVLTLRTTLPGATELEGASVLEARFAGDATVILGIDHVLAVHRAGGAPIALDETAYGPLSIAGTLVAYVRGEEPLFEVATADVRTGALRTITDGMAPAWSPALSPDGRELVFVSGVLGSPRLYRVAIGGGNPVRTADVRALPPSARFPTSPNAPRWEGGVLRFEDEQGAAAFDLAQGRLLDPSELGGAR